MTGQKDKNSEAFLSRWSRRKLGAAREPQAPKPQAPSADSPGSGVAPIAKTGDPAKAEPPPLEEVGFDTDFRAFMGKEVDEGLRRAALKKLFADPRFNVMDGLDTYIDDYTRGESIAPELLAKLEHAKHTLFGPRPEEKETAQDPAAAQRARDESAAQDAAHTDADKKAEGEDGAAG